MTKRIVLAGVAFISIFSNAMMSNSELLGYQESLAKNRAYITSNGHYVNVMIPINELYLGKTTYLTDSANHVGNVFTKLIARSSGKIALQGLVNSGDSDINFNTSAVYAQVSHLSEYLFSNTTDISYAPVVVNVYEKNNNYGIWKIYPDDETFLNLTLIID